MTAEVTIPMDSESDDQPPPLPQITLRGLLLFNTVIGLFLSFLSALGFGDVRVGVIVTLCVLGVLFLLQLGTFWLVMRLSRGTEDELGEWRDPRNSFPQLPRDRS